MWEDAPFALLTSAEAPGTVDSHQKLVESARTVLHFLVELNNTTVSALHLLFGGCTSGGSTIWLVEVQRIIAPLLSASCDISCLPGYVAKREHWTTYDLLSSLQPKLPGAKNSCNNQE